MALDDRHRAWRYAPGLIGCLLVQAALTSVVRAAEEQEVPDLELLAYLGSWPAGDEEWVAVVEWDGKVETTEPPEADPDEEKDDE